MSCAFQQCKNFENRLRFDKVTDSSKVETFLRHSVLIMSVNRIRLKLASNASCTDKNTNIRVVPSFPHTTNSYHAVSVMNVTDRETDNV